MLSGFGWCQTNAGYLKAEPSAFAIKRKLALTIKSQELGLAPRHFQQADSALLYVQSKAHL